MRTIPLGTIESSSMVPEGSMTPCVLCGRHVDENKAKWVRMHCGVEIVHNDDQGLIEEHADGGLWPVGPHCSKRVPKEYLS